MAMFHICKQKRGLNNQQHKGGDINPEILLIHQLLIKTLFLRRKLVHLMMNIKNLLVLKIYNIGDSDGE